MKGLFFAALTLLTTACSDPTDSQDRITIRIHGRVIAEATGLPVVGASVSLRTIWIDFLTGSTTGQSFATTTSGADGTYSLSATLACDDVVGNLYLVTTAEGMVDPGYPYSIGIECVDGDRAIDVTMEYLAPSLLKRG